jgi:histidine triad (HIT) family protein
VTNFDPSCLFCKIIQGKIPAHRVYEDDESYAFLDIHPLFPGHVLVTPKQHFATLYDVPMEYLGPLFESAQLVGKAVESAVEAEGTFVAINNRISQTVAHLHIHVVPRRRGDGLKGFFWPRNDYRDDEAREAVRAAIEREAQRLAEASLESKEDGRR